MSQEQQMTSAQSEEPTLDKRLVLAIENFRQLTKEYYLKDESSQKSIRHTLYTQHGRFAKELFVPVLARVKEIEDSIPKKG